MPDNLPPNDPRNIWQSQPTEPFHMPAEIIRKRAQRLITKAKWETLLWVTVGLVVSVAFGRNFARVSEVVPRLGWALLSLWGAYSAYQACRWIWPRCLAPDATVATTLSFYRSELERRRDHSLHDWRRAGLPVAFFGMAMIAVPGLVKAFDSPRLLLNVLPFFLLLAMWAITFLSTRKRRRQMLQEEIDEANALEGDGRS